MSGFFAAIKRFFLYFNLMAEKASETDAINEAIVERGMRDNKAKADKALYANGQLKGQIILLKDQVRRQGMKKDELSALIGLAIKQNDDKNGAIYAEELATLESDFNDNSAQLKDLEVCYGQNTQIIADALRQIQAAQREFEQLKARVAISRSLEGLATMMKASVTELQGALGGETASAMERMRQNAVKGQGQVAATMDIAKEMGANIMRKQEARNARGAALFAELKAKANAQVATPAVESTPSEKTETRQKIAV